NGRCLMSVPVLVVAFNRPRMTSKVFEALKLAKPKKLFFAVDGPRQGRSEDAALVRSVRELMSDVDWSCEVETLFRDTNLGCKAAVSQAISWFFDHVEEGIVLEDDCIAHESYFPFAEELLTRFRDDERVMMISGDNFQRGAPRTNYSYYFSRYTHIWGWATWRRAWRLYDHRMKAWPELREGRWLLDVLGDARAADYWGRIFEETYSERNTSWAYRWMFSTWVQSGLTVLPNVNLVSNIGFGELATNTHQRDDSISAVGVAEMAFPLKHPAYVIRDARADALTQRKLFYTPPYWRRVSGRAYRAIFRR
ncbi:MAG: hypothetical protein ACREUQ_06950, partial [Burkholderiales bacterium]